MDLDFSDIQLSAPAKAAPIEPKRIFNSLTLRGSIDNIWEPQDKAVGDWFALRDRADVAIEMATGGGKTLVGLLVGQSSVNELRKPGLYVCPTVQLAEQTRTMALENGFAVAAYLESRWEDDAVYDEARGLCVTTYAAVFNSRSRLSRQARPGVIVFDDAHVAGDEVRRQYSDSPWAPSLRSNSRPCASALSRSTRSGSLRCARSQRPCKAVVPAAIRDAADCRAVAPPLREA